MGGKTKLRRCKGLLHLENLGGLLIRNERSNKIHGYCPECGLDVALDKARRTCNRLVQR